MRGKIIVLIACGLLFATIFIGLSKVASADTAKQPDLRVSDLWRGYIGPTRYWQVGYTLYNAGQGNIVNAEFSDAGYYYWGAWYKISASEQRHYSFNLESQHYSDDFFYNWYAPPGIHLLSQWTDIYQEVSDSNYDNNYKSVLWNWNDL